MPATTCSLYWLNANTNAVSSSITDIKAQCDSGFATCNFPTSKSNGFAAGEIFSCTGNLMFPTTLSFQEGRSGYICNCGSARSTPPDPTLFSCTDACYKLDDEKKCSFIALVLNSNPTFMDNGKGQVKGSNCASLRCGAGENSELCTDNKGSVQYTCDNQLQSNPVKKGSGYVCNCKGAAQVPNGFGKTGTIDACSGKQSSGSGETASATPSATASAAVSTASASATSASSSASASAGAANKNSASTIANFSLKNLVTLIGISVVVMGLMG